MKIAVTGKGGVGKTSIAAGLSLLFKNEGREVIAIDADPDANLAIALGFPESKRPTPISELKKLILERSGEVGAFFKLNPKVDDIPDAFSQTHQGIRLIEMGTIKKPGAGCVCPESAFLKALLSHIILNRGEVVIVDMEAGVEHLGRGTAQSVDKFIIVIEPNNTSLDTARKIKKYAENLGIKEISIIANKIRGKEDTHFIEKNKGDLSIETYIRFDDSVLNARGVVIENSNFMGDLKGVFDGKTNR